MIPEKMLELLVLSDFIKEQSERLLSDVITIDRIDYSTDKILNRFIELNKEFLEPYVINSDSKE